MIQIHITEKVSPKILEFLKKEWKTADIKYRGKEMTWLKTNKVLTAYEDQTLVGVLELNYVAGVMYIEEIIVAFDYHKKGIGTLLMKNAEDIAREAGLHKIYLETGKTWGIASFYENLGYIQTGEMPKHSGGQDYVQYSKFL